MTNPYRLTVFSLLLAITGSAFTQATSGNIIGDGNPGDTVVISGDSNGFKREISIKSDGKYKLRHVPIGSYHVTFIQADGKIMGIRNLVWVLAPWVFVAITFKEWILVLDG